MSIITPSPGSAPPDAGAAVAVARLVVGPDLALIEAAPGGEGAARVQIASGHGFEPEVEACIRQVFATGEPVLGVLTGGQGGAEPRMQWSFLPLFTGDAKVQQVQMLVERAHADVSLAEFEEAQRAQARLAAVVESAQDAIISKNLDGVVQSWNRSAERLFGYRAEEMIGRSIMAIIPDDRRDEEASILTRIRNGQPVERYETIRVRKDGRRVSVDLTVSPVRNLQGEIIGASKIAQDVAARKAMETALRRREEELKIITDAVPALISYIGPDLRYRFNNLAYERWFGREPGSLQGRHMRELLGDRAYETILPYAQRALNGETVRFETWADYRDGGKRYIDASYLPRRDAQGQVEGFFVLVSDLTARKQAEERVRESEARYRTLINSLSDGIVLADAQRRIALVNPAFSRIFGYPAEQVIGRSTLMLYADPDAFHRLGEQHYHPRADSEVADYEIQYRRADGSTFWAETRGSAIHDEQGALMGYLGILRDITRRKQAQDALRESEERFRLMTETIPDTIFTSRADGTCDYVNPRWYEYTGAAAGSAQGFGWLEAVHPDDREALLERWQKTVSHGRTFEYKYRMRGADGHYRWNIARSQLLTNAEGSVSKWLGVCTDIDDMVRAQEALKDSHRRKDEFLAMLAHELRNPLAPILTSVEVLQLQPELLQGKVGWATDIIQRQTLHLVHLVDDLLDIARIVSGRIQLRRTTADLRTLAAQAAENMRHRLELKDLQLHLAPADEPVPVHADTGRITQVLDNLLDNAVKYTDPGGQIWLDVEREQDQAVLRIRDTGIGIAADHLARVFELFEQADPEFDRGHGGLGLGLHLVQRLVHMHDGTVEVHSEGRNRGAEFTVRLPLLQAQAESAAQLQAPQPGSSASRRVLIVEDNRDIADALKTLLQVMGHQARTVADGPSCLDVVERYHPHLILLDLGLPGMNGYEVAAALRERYPEGSLRVVALTGYGRDEDRRRSREAGFDHHLVKPVDQEALKRLLQDEAP